MSIFKRKNKQKNEAENKDYNWMTVAEALAYSNGKQILTDDSVMKVAAELCEQIKFLRVQQQAVTKEFEQVTQFLSDVQKIENLPEHVKGEICDTARTLMGLDIERDRFRSGKNKLISPSDYKCMDMYSEEIPDKLVDLGKKEDYLNLIKEDMHKLEGEKGSISYNRTQAEDKRKFLNRMSYCILAICVTVFIVLIMLTSYTLGDYKVPFLLTGICVVCYLIYYFATVRKCLAVSRRSTREMNRANQLLNKVKVKYVNTTNALEYSYEKYHVNNLMELQYKWQTFVRVKEEEKRFRSNTNLLNEYRRKLTMLLDSIGFTKSDTWSVQPEVFIDRGELLTFKDAITKRRNKLRMQMDYNIRQQDNAMNDIEALKRRYISQINIINYCLEQNKIE